MSDDLAPEKPRLPPDEPTLGMSALYKLFEAFISLREKNERQHKLFEQSLTKARDNLQAGFNSFAADTQRAYQQLRQEVHGEKRVSLALLNELLEVGQDLERVVAAKPDLAPLGQAAEPVARWVEGVEILCRKVQA